MNWLPQIQSRPSPRLYIRAVRDPEITVAAQSAAQLTGLTITPVVVTAPALNPTPGTATLAQLTGLTLTPIVVNAPALTPTPGASTLAQITGLTLTPVVINAPALNPTPGASSLAQITGLALTPVVIDRPAEPAHQTTAQVSLTSLTRTTI